MIYYLTFPRFCQKMATPPFLKFDPAQNGELDPRGTPFKPPTVVICIQPSKTAYMRLPYFSASEYM